MTINEMNLIKSTALKWKQLLYKTRALKETLEKQVGTYAELKAYADELESVERILYANEILGESDLYKALRNKFTEISSSTTKKLYYLYGYLRESSVGDYFESIKKHCLYVPINSENKEYAELINVVDEKDYQIVKISEMDDFRKRHYVIDGVEIEAPYASEVEYGFLRLYSVCDDYDYNVDDDYQNCREMFFMEFVNAGTEDKAIEKAYVRSKNRK